MLGTERNSDVSKQRSGNTFSKSDENIIQQKKTPNFLVENQENQRSNKVSPPDLTEIENILQRKGTLRKAKRNDASCIS